MLKYILSIICLFFNYKIIVSIYYIFANFSLGLYDIEYSNDQISAKILEIRPSNFGYFRKPKNVKVYDLVYEYILDGHTYRSYSQTTMINEYKVGEKVDILYARSHPEYSYIEHCNPNYYGFYETLTRGILAILLLSAMNLVYLFFYYKNFPKMWKPKAKPDDRL